MDYVFIIGTGRCGSTLLARALAYHPDVAYISAADERLRRFGTRGGMNGRLYRSAGRLPAVGRGGEWLAMRYQPSEAWVLLSEEVSEMLVEPCRDLTEADATPWVSARLERFFEARCRAQRRELLLHKFTGWPRARFLHSVFPHARFIHMVRDGRAVANSWLQTDWWQGYRGPSGWPFGDLSESYRAEWQASRRSFPVLAGIQWKILLDACAEARGAIPSDQWLEVRYEDLVADPAHVLNEVATFGRLAPERWNPTAVSDMLQISGQRQSAFVLELPERDRRLLAEGLSDHLREYGYPD